MKDLSIQSIEPERLSEEDFLGIHEVMQDMWASEAGLGEFVQCLDCKRMMSKEDIFGALTKDMQGTTVAEMIRDQGITSISCIDCYGETRFIYDGQMNIEKIKNRVLNSVDAFLVICKDGGRIVGFEEGYVDSLDRMFDLDLKDHYGNVGLSEIKRRVRNVLGYTPEQMLLTSALGLLEPYRNFQNLYEIMHQFARTLPDAYIGMPGLTEMHRGGVTHRMSDGINQGISLGIEDDPLLRAKMTDVGEKYNCDLVVYEDYVGMHKDYFMQGPRKFLQKIRKPKEEIRENIGIELRVV